MVFKGQIMDRNFLDSLIGRTTKGAESVVKEAGWTPLLVEQGVFLPNVERLKTVILTHRNNIITFAESGEDD